MFRRNQNFVDILRLLSLGEKQLGAFDISLRFTHLFWCGDLNYRLDLDVQVSLPFFALFENRLDSTCGMIVIWEIPDSDFYCFSPHWLQDILKHVSKREFEELMCADQLTRERHKRKAFLNFSESQVPVDLGSTLRAINTTPDSYCIRINAILQLHNPW